VTFEIQSESGTAVAFINVHAASLQRARVLAHHYSGRHSAADVALLVSHTDGYVEVVHV
jgi:hypothetical protein